jgi:ParB family chromosome partitioning protein
LRIQRIPVELLDPNPYQPRLDFDVAALNELVNSLREHGLMQPIVVRRHEDRFQIIAGERRWRASQELGWDMIDAVAIDADDRKMIEWALVENVQREQLGPMELARAFRQMNREFGQTQEEIAKAVGMSRPNVANMIRLLDLAPAIQERVSRGTISAGAARALLGLPKAEDQARLADEIERLGMNVRAVEERVKQALSSKPKPLGAPPLPSDPNQEALQRELASQLSTRVLIKGSLKAGRLQIDYHSSKELDRLVRRLRGEAPRLAPPEAGGLEEESETFRV